jgi:hypothetical protein
MAREILLIATTNGTHWLEFGLNNDEIADFSIQLWVEKHGERTVDWCQSLGNGFVTFMGGDLWVHNSDTAPRCNLYGEQKDCIMGIIANEQPTKVKIFDSIAISTDGEWEITEITIPKSLNYPHGMYSKLPKELFKKRDGVYRAQFLRNMKTHQSTASVIDAINGEPLRGNECYMVLRNVNNPTGEQIKLFKVNIGATSTRI